GYSTNWPTSAASIAQILQANGYNTAAIGKWHLTPDSQQGPAGPFDRWPNALGFDYFWGFLGGESGQFDPVLAENNSIIGVPTEKNFYLNDAMVDHATTWIRDQKAQAPDKPFFLYFSTGATHAPHQVPKEWSEKYKGKFDQGWDKLREETFARQKQLGVIPTSAKLTPRDPAFPAWDSVPPELKKVYTRQMEVYAGYQENTDHAVARVVKAIEDMGLSDNTLIIYISAAFVTQWLSPGPNALRRKAVCAANSLTVPTSRQPFWKPPACRSRRKLTASHRCRCMA